MDSTKTSFIRGHIAPLLAAAGMGLVFAILAIVSQDGLTRGYTSVLLLFVSLGLAVLGFVAGIVTVASEKFGTAFELIASAVILPATFLLIMFAVSVFTGE